MKRESRVKGQGSRIRKDERGFTLVELAIVLVIVGLLIGMGASLIGPLTKRAKLHETREIVRTAYESILGYAAKNKSLPDDLTSLGVKTTDAYNRPLSYYPITFDNLCTETGTYLTVNDSSSGTLVPKSTVAFLIFSQGENLCTQTGAASPFAIALADATVACDDGSNDAASYDDIVVYQDIDAIRDKICNTFRIVTDSLPTGTEEAAYSSTTLEATDGTTPYEWTVSSGSLPSGLELSGAGAITGTPATDGSYNFTVQVADNEDPARTATKSLSITINPNKPRITTEFLSYVTVNQAYPSTTLSATGGKSPYTWAVTGGSLPAGLILNASSGAISGTPTAAGAYPFTVTVTDNGLPQRTASKTLSITINPESSSSGSSGSGSSSSGSSGSGSSSGTSSPPTCSLSASPGNVPYNTTATLSWSVTNGPALISFSPASGTCTNFSDSTGGSCSTAAITNGESTTFTVTVTNGAGSNTCNTTIYGGCEEYRVWNNLNDEYDFHIDGSFCLDDVEEDREITGSSKRLNVGETIDRLPDTSPDCTGSVIDQITYNQAMNADVSPGDQDCRVNFTGTDR